MDYLLQRLPRTMHPEKSYIMYTWYIYVVMDNVHWTSWMSKLNMCVGRKTGILFVCLFVCLFFVCLLVCLFTCLFVCLTRCIIYENETELTGYQFLMTLPPKNNQNLIEIKKENTGIS